MSRWIWNLHLYEKVYSTGWGVCFGTTNRGYWKFDVKDTSKWYQYQLNIYKKYIFAQSYKGVAWNLSLPHPFQFWTSYHCLTAAHFYLMQCRYQKMVLISFEHLLKIHYFLKLHGRSSKIEPTAPFSIFSFENLKWVW